MANEDNLKGHGFHERTASERRELAKKAGKKSGETRRKKADLRRTLNMLLTAEIDHEEWTPFLESLGLDSTLESAISAAMIKEAMKGDVQAFRTIRETIGQTTKSDADLKEQEAKIKSTELDNAVKEKVQAGGSKTGLGAAIVAAYAKRKEQEGNGN